MAKLNWIKYSSDNATKDDIQRKLTGIRIEFGGSKPRIKGGTCMLPRKGAICPIGEDRFVLRHTERIQEYERGYWVGRGTPGYGQEWLSSSEARYLDDDDRFLLGRERLVPSGYRDETGYFYGGKEHGTLFLTRIDDELAKKLENDIDSFIAKYNDA